jgi:hypothetical protein
MIHVEIRMTNEQAIQKLFDEIDGLKQDIQKLFKTFQRSILLTIYRAEVLRQIGHDAPERKTQKMPQRTHRHLDAARRAAYSAAMI